MQVSSSCCLLLIYESSLKILLRVRVHCDLLLPLLGTFVICSCCYLYWSCSLTYVCEIWKWVIFKCLYGLILSWKGWTKNGILRVQPCVIIIMTIEQQWISSIQWVPHVAFFKLKFISWAFEFLVQHFEYGFSCCRKHIAESWW